MRKMALLLFFCLLCLSGCQKVTTLAQSAKVYEGLWTNETFTDGGEGVLVELKDGNEASVTYTYLSPEQKYSVTQTKFDTQIIENEPHYFSFEDKKLKGSITFKDGKILWKNDSKGAKTVVFTKNEVNQDLRLLPKPVMVGLGFLPKEKTTYYYKGNQRVERKTIVFKGNKKGTVQAEIKGKIVTYQIDETGLYQLEEHSKSKLLTFPLKEGEAWETNLGQRKILSIDETLFGLEHVVVVQEKISNELMVHSYYHHDYGFLGETSEPLTSSYSVDLTLQDIY